jgi:hypothetical protein
VDRIIDEDELEWIGSLWAFASKRNKREVN